MRIIAAWSMLFLSTPSARRATNYAPLLCLLVRYFYPRPPRGGRQLRSATLSSRSVFLSTPSARRATTTTLPICQEVFYFYPRPPRGGRLDYKFKHCNSDCISIHALREEGDSTSMLFAAAFFLFLSTPSARRATCFTMLFIQNNLNFYPRPPRGGRRDRSNARRHQAVFLSTPSARRATTESAESGRTCKFLSTPSARRATLMGWSAERSGPISIHALREEGDSTCKIFLEDNPYFYPRPPRGGRLFRVLCYIEKAKISIHALREEGDFRVLCYIEKAKISIHALREEGDNHLSVL